MHSSRMLQWSLEEGCLPRGGYLRSGCVRLGGVSQHALCKGVSTPVLAGIHPPCEQNDWQTPVKYYLAVTSLRTVTSEDEINTVPPIDFRRKYLMHFFFTPPQWKNVSTCTKNISTVSKYFSYSPPRLPFPQHTWFVSIGWFKWSALVGPPPPSFFLNLMQLFGNWQRLGLVHESLYPPLTFAAEM